MKKATTTKKALIEEFEKHSREYHTPKDDITRRISNGDGGQDGIASIIAKLDTMDKRISTMGQSIHALQVGCDNCSGPHLTKDCDLMKNVYKKARICYSSGDKFDED